MTLDEFRKKYCQAVEEILPELHMDAERIRDELHHRRMRERQRKRMLVKSAAAAAVFMLITLMPILLWRPLRTCPLKK